MEGRSNAAICGALLGAVYGSEGSVIRGQKTRVSGQEPEQSAKPAVDAPRAEIAFTPGGDRSSRAADP
jgi:hypothetical protein